MAVSSSSNKGKGRANEKKYARGVCWNCGKKCHYKDKCIKPAKIVKDPKTEVESKKSGTANAAVDSDSEGKAVFLMSSDSGSVKSEVGNLDFEEGDWFSEMEEDEWESGDSDTDSLENSSSSDILEDILVATESANPGQHTYT